MEELQTTMAVVGSRARSSTRMDDQLPNGARNRRPVGRTIGRTATGRSPGVTTAVERGGPNGSRPHSTMNKVLKWIGAGAIKHLMINLTTSAALTPRCKRDRVGNRNGAEASQAETMKIDPDKEIRKQNRSKDLAEQVQGNIMRIVKLITAVGAAWTIIHQTRSPAAGSEAMKNLRTTMPHYRIRGAERTKEGSNEKMKERKSKRTSEGADNRTKIDPKSSENRSQINPKSIKIVDKCPPEAPKDPLERKVLVFCPKSVPKRSQNGAQIEQKSRQIS